MHTSGHGRTGRRIFLRNFRGYLQADAAPIDDNLFNDPKQLILEVGCWMHGRRQLLLSRPARRIVRVRTESALAQDLATVRCRE